MSQDAAAIFQSLAEKDRRYRREAYAFTFEAFNYTMEERRREGQEGHIDGRYLCDGIRRYAENCFGYLTRTVFSQWGVTRTEDFGEIVFAMVDAGLMRKRDSDSIADFSNAYDFSEVFEQSFLD
ncbi:MAG: hypothetical protein H6807_14815 [Planctomycetes bacterium]|nr:hypothetical protein [Planctomycetota bacterium]